MAQRSRGAVAAGGTRRGGSPTGAVPAPVARGVTRGELAALRARLRAEIDPVVAAAGLDLEELAVTRVGRRHLVRVVVDGDGGVDHDELSRISRDISTTLDEIESTGDEITEGAYTLEVSSPGVDRPLTEPRHWRRNVGRLVKTTVDGRTIEARVVAVDERGVFFADRSAAVPFGDLGPGRVQIEFTHLAELSEDESADELDSADGLDFAGDDADESDEREEEGES